PSTWKLGPERPGRGLALEMLLLVAGPSLPGKSPMDCGHSGERGEETPSTGTEPDSLLPSAAGSNSSTLAVAGRQAGASPGRPAAANAARERSRVQTLRHAFLELQKTLPSVPPDTKLSKLDVLLLATTYIAHLTRSLQDEEESPGEGLVPALSQSPHGNLGDPPPNPSERAGGDRPQPQLGLLWLSCRAATAWRVVLITGHMLIPSVKVLF
uniref:Transcription factor 24 n=1 Tax=Strigops habroptila TaxID=2489341 RepID=A0A672TE01_STRHB